MKGNPGLGTALGGLLVVIVLGYLAWHGSLS